MDRPEPRLEELLDDPLVRLLMERDAVDREAVKALFSSLRAGRIDRKVMEGREARA